MPGKLSLSERMVRKLRDAADWRCAEPVVVFEADDWGLQRRACSDFIQTFAVPGGWADEELETAEDLQHLYRVLERHRDVNGRPACFTANFVVANPDFEAIARDQFSLYHDIPISQMDELKGQWLEGLERRVFFPQYHGRSHFWSDAWLRDLQHRVPGAREMFDRRFHGGLSLALGEDWRYHSEYTSWWTGEERTGDELSTWLVGGIKTFQETFGFFPRSTIATHYILTDALADAWSSAGGEFIQGTNYRILRGAKGQPRFLAHTLGEPYAGGLLLMGRAIKFDPRPQRVQHGVRFAFRQIKRCFESRVPAVVDTHRINYTGRWGKASIEQLDALLCALKPYRPRFLTSVELGEAISQNGAYKDHWSGEIAHLTPYQQPWRKILRSRFNAHTTTLAAQQSTDSVEAGSVTLPG